MLSVYEATDVRGNRVKTNTRYLYWLSYGESSASRNWILIHKLLGTLIPGIIKDSIHGSWSLCQRSRCDAAIFA